jgi:hypothetical protein
MLDCNQIIRAEIRFLGEVRVTIVYAINQFVHLVVELVICSC